MINLNKKTKSNIIHLFVGSYLILACADGNQQNPRITPQTPQDKEKKQIQLLQKKVKDKLKASDIELDDLNIQAIPKKKQELNKLLTLIKNINKKIKSADEFFNKREPFKKEKEQQKFYNNNKLIKKSYDKIEEAMKKRKALEEEAKKQQPNEKNLLTKTNLELENLIKKGSNETDKNKIANFITKYNITSKEINKIAPVDYKKYINLIDDLNTIFPNENAVKVYNNKGQEYKKENMQDYFHLNKANEISEQSNKYKLLLDSKELLNYMIKSNIDNLDSAQELYKKNPKVIQSMILRAKIMKEFTDLSKSSTLAENKNKYYTEKDNVSETDTIETITKIKTLIEKDKEELEKGIQLDKKYEKLKNKYFFDFTTNKNKKLIEQDIKNLKNLLANTKKFKAEEQSKILDKIIQIISQVENLTKLKQIPNTEKTGLYFTKLPGTTNLLTTSEQIITELELLNDFNNINNETLENIKTKLDNALLNVDEIMTNAKQISELYNKAVLKESNTSNFDKTNPQPGDITNYSTTNELKTSQPNKVFKLLDRQNIINTLVKNYSSDLDSVKNIMNKNINNKKQTLDDNIAELKKEINKYKAKDIVEQQNSNPNLLPVVKQIINNNNPYTIKETIDIDNLKENNTPTNYKKNLIENLKEKDESIIYYNKKTKNTVFNTELDIKNLNDKIDITNKLKALIELMKEVYELTDKKQLIKSKIKSIQTIKNKTSFEEFFKIYVNIKNLTGRNISHQLSDKLIASKNDLIQLNNYIRIVKVLNSNGLDLKLKSKQGESFIDILNKDKASGNWEIQFNDDQKTLKNINFIPSTL